MNTPTSVVCLSSIRLSIRSEPHAFAPVSAAAIAAYWADATARNPRLFNGSAYLFDRLDLNAPSGTLEAQGALTDFAKFLYWRTHREDMALDHIFPVGAIVTADRRLLVGRMSAHTANPGKLYPPAGSFDANDLILADDGSGTLDPLANIRRELQEEIGLDIARLSLEPDWLMLPSGKRSHALVRILRTPEPSGDLAPAMRRHIADDPHQELDDIQFLDVATRLPEETTMPYVNHLLAYLATTG